MAFAEKISWTRDGNFSYFLSRVGELYKSNCKYFLGFFLNTASYKECIKHFYIILLIEHVNTFS